jgi:Putative transposase
MSKTFRGKFTDGLYRLDQKGDIMLTQPIDLEQKHLHPLYRRKWVVFAKRPVAGSEKAIEYIGRYAQRIAIANSRIKEVTEEKVTFSWVDYRNSKTSNMSLEGVEFLRRFVEHILPQGFVKIRHYGILSNRLKNQALDAAYRSEGQQRPEKLPAMPWFELIEMICGKDPLLCPKCKKAKLSIVAILPPKRAGPNDDFTLNTGFYRVA